MGCTIEDIKALNPEYAAYTADDKIIKGTVVQRPANSALKNTEDHDNVNTVVPSVTNEINEELKNKLANLPVEVEEEGSWWDWIGEIVREVLIQVGEIALEASGLDIVIAVVKTIDAVLDGDMERAAKEAKELAKKVAQRAIPLAGKAMDIIDKINTVVELTDAASKGDWQKVGSIVAQEAISKVAEKATQKIQKQVETWKGEMQQGITPVIPSQKNNEKLPTVIVDARIEKLRTAANNEKIRIEQQKLAIPERELIENNNKVAPIQTPKTTEEKPKIEKHKDEEEKKVQTPTLSYAERIAEIQKNTQYLSAEDRKRFDEIASQKHTVTAEKEAEIKQFEDSIRANKNAPKRLAQVALDDLKLNKLKSKLEGADQPTRDRFYDDFETLNDDKKAALRAMDSDDKVFEAWKTANTLSSKTRTNPIFLDKLKTLRADTELQDHIFKVELDGNQVKGGHIQSIINGTNVRYKNGVDNGINPPTNAPINNDGVLNADIEVLRTLRNPDQTPQLNTDGSIKQIWQEKKLRGGDIQTFFPANWSKDKILAECASALVNPQKGLAAGKTRLWEARSDSGVVIRWFLDVNDATKVKSIFPKL